MRRRDEEKRLGEKNRGREKKKIGEEDYWSKD